MPGKTQHSQRVLQLLSRSGEFPNDLKNRKWLSNSDHARARLDSLQLPICLQPHNIAQLHIGLFCFATFPQGILALTHI